MSAEWLSELSTSRASWAFSRRESPMTRESAEWRVPRLECVERSEAGMQPRERRSKDLMPYRPKSLKAISSFLAEVGTEGQG